MFRFNYASTVPKIRSNKTNFAEQNALPKLINMFIRIAKSNGFLNNFQLA